MSRLNRVIAFIEAMPVTKGIRAGHKIELLTDQREFLTAIYGQKHPVRLAIRSMPRGNGKGLALDTPLPTPTGWTTMAAVQPGDWLIDERGQECRVTMVNSIRLLDCYRIRFSNGETIIADGDHRWRTLARQELARLSHWRRQNPLASRANAVRETRDIFATQRYGKRGDVNHRVALPDPIRGRAVELPIDPYVLGVWLGDGTTKNASITCGKLDLLEMQANLQACGIDAAIRYSSDDRAPSLVLRAVERLLDGTYGIVAKGSSNNLQIQLRQCGVLDHKHIPTIYLRASQRDRLALLQGLMDTDGGCDQRRGQCEFTTINSHLADQFGELLSTFGIKFGRSIKQTGFCPAHRFLFTVHRKYIELFRLKRKLALQHESSGFGVEPTRGVTIESVERIENVPTKCLQVDSPSRMFLCGKTMIPTHNTGLAAALALCHLLGPEAEPRGEVYSAAIDRQQASIIFQEMEAILCAYRGFSTRVNIIRHSKRIEIMSGDGVGSTYEALSSDVRRAHGLSPTLFIYDELGQARDRELLDNLQTAMGKRKRSLGVIISTQAPSDEHPLSQIIDDALSRDDPAIVCHLLAASEDADPFAIETIRSVNPALGHFLNEPDLVSEAERARNSPAFEAAFRNLRLNQRVDSSAEERLVEAAVWRRGAIAVDRASLRGKKCFAALDLSAVHDLTAVTLVFPDAEQRPTFDVLQFFWTPADQVERRVASEREKFREWIREGYIEAIPGPTIQFDWVAQRLIELAKEFQIEVMGFDSWRVKQFAQDLHRIDPNWPVPLDAFVQGYKGFTPAIAEFRDIAENDRLRHGGNPVLTACVVSAIVDNGPTDGKMLNKKKSRWRGPVRIDGAVTLCMALELAKRVDKPKMECLAMVA